jgi:dinuclear metal center YbgI/SA1388 family protein
MITLQELCLYLDEHLQCALISDFCANGLQVEGERAISQIATAVSASLDTIQKAVELKSQALIVHHGLFWNRDTHVIKGVKRKKLELLLRNNISLLCYHLPLDMHQQLGNNWKAALEMGWTDLKPFCTLNGLSIGVQGKIPPQPREKFRESLEAYYQHAANCAFGGKEQVHTAALISGGAHKNLKDAVVANVDCYITGSFDEPNWHEAHEERINFFALGHSATERVGPRALGEHLQRKFNLQNQFIDIPNPF